MTSCNFTKALRFGLPVLIGLTAGAFLVESKVFPYWKFTGSLALFSATVAALPKAKPCWVAQHMAERHRRYYRLQNDLSPFQ